MTPIKQASFAGGEIAPSLYGRSDLAKYETALKTCKNFIISKTGALKNRPGLVYLGAAKNNTKKSRLIPFIFSNDQAYALEFGDCYIRVWRNGAQIQIQPDDEFYAWDEGKTYALNDEVTKGSRVFRSLQNSNTDKDPEEAGNSAWWVQVSYEAPAVLELGAPYSESDIPYLKYAQVGDVLTLTCRGYYTLELKRYDDDNWKLGPVSFDRPQAYFTDGLKHAPMITPVDATHLLWNDAIADGTPDSTDSSHPFREWKWKVTVICQDSKGNTWETAPYDVSKIRVRNYPGWSASTTYASGDNVSADFSSSFYTSIQNGNTNHAVTDAAWWSGPWGNSNPPQYEISLPKKMALFVDKPLLIEWPITGLLYTPDYRIITFRVYRGRGEVFGWIGDTTDDEWLDEGTEPDYSQPPPRGRNPFKIYGYNGSLVQTEVPSAVAFFEQRRCFANTYNPEENIGRPGFLFCSRSGDYANFDTYLIGRDDDALEFELAASRFEEIRSLVPGSKLLAFTQSSVWRISGAANGDPLSRSSIDAKSFLSVGANWVTPVRVGETAVFANSRGGIHDVSFEQGGANLSLIAEHLFRNKEVVDLAYQEAPESIVWAVRSDGIMLGLTYLREQELWAWHQHETDGAVESVCVIPEGNSDALYAVVKRVINNTTKRFVERMAKGDSDYVAAGTYLDCATVVEAEGSGPEDLITSVTGLSYLQGAYVSMLADNKVIGPVKLNGSSMSVPSGGALRVVVGLPYNSDAELLDLVPGRTRLKSVVSAAFEVEATSGIQAGEDFDHLTTVNEPSVSVAPKGTTGLVEVIIASAWNKGGRAVIRQSKPFQCHILSAIRQIEVGGA